MMKKTIPFLKAISVSAALLAFSAAASVKPSPPKAPAAAESSTAVVAYSEGEIYTLKEYNGRIAVFRGGDAAPYEIFDIFTKSLPEEDRTALSLGITAKSPEELRKLLEDYTG